MRVAHRRTGGKYDAANREFRRQRAADSRASQRLARENRTKRLGKLLNLSVNGATEHERRLARQKYNQLKGVKVA